MSTVIIKLKHDGTWWKLTSPSGVELWKFREKYEHKALERARAWASTWNDWSVRLDSET